MRRRKLLAAVAAVGLIAMSVQAATGAAPAATAAALTGSASVTDLGTTGGWKVLTSATATQSGAQISTPGFGTSGWLTVADDGAGAPPPRSPRCCRTASA